MFRKLSVLCQKRNSANKQTNKQTKTKTKQQQNKKNLSSAQRMYENVDLIYHNNNNQRKNVVVQNVYTRISLGSEAKRNDNAVNGFG